MKKLKTLEDMENWMPMACYPNLLNEPWALMVSSKDPGSPPEDEGYYAHSELREEAIKWIKELKRLMKIKNRPLSKVDTNVTPMVTILHKPPKYTSKGFEEPGPQDVALMYISILAHIFNIEDKDLD